MNVSNVGFQNSPNIQNLSNKIETGTVEQGEKSNQQFETSYGTFDSFSFFEITWKILPLSQKPYVSSEIKKYCPECGGRIKKPNFKFCPYCGTKL